MITYTPDRFKYQINGKTAHENYIDMRKEKNKVFQDLKINLENDLEEFILNQVESILKGLKF